MRWVELVNQKAAQGAHPRGGHQPHDKGFSRAGRVIGVSRRNVERASKIAAICKEAKAEIRRLNLDVRRHLLAIGAEPEELQLAKLYELTRDRKSESADEAPEEGGGRQPDTTAQEPGGCPHEEGEEQGAIASGASEGADKTFVLRSGDGARAEQPTTAEESRVASRE